ncbi:hypothetical protein CHS0354_010636 [Potamilus streckersoni]|uniref:Uncharacterized protein n=1 Tax=Potamilus streckersoni TaxID=2493646 RepID=A0AAE0SES3_9BIVA|nr:hypothetical protein CHS0354_010636 [Potamilus streckersoni]
MTSTLIRISVLMLVSSLCICYRGNDTVSNDACWYDHKCGKHGYYYSWCYIDKKRHWDYCCDDLCTYDANNLLRCTSGTLTVECGSSGTVTANGFQCKDWHSCGHHREYYYWCYTPTSWEYCCHPNERCRYISEWNGYYCNAAPYRYSDDFLVKCDNNVVRTRK